MHVTNSQSWYFLGVRDVEFDIACLHANLVVKSSSNHAVTLSVARSSEPPSIL